MRINNQTFSILLLLGGVIFFGTSCKSSKKGKLVEWHNHKDFALPFTMVYQGPTIKDKSFPPLKHGFSHIDLTSLDPRLTPKLPPQNRSLLWTYVAYMSKEQPWAKMRSPWNNNQKVLEQGWDRWFSIMNKKYGTKKHSILESDILMADIEACWYLDKDILKLQKDPNTPNQFKRMSRKKFIAQYGKDMSALYASSLTYLKRKAKKSHSKISSYMDTPIVCTWHDIGKISWKQWKENEDNVCYLVKRDKKNQSSQRSGNSFYDDQDWMSVTAYYPYDEENYPDFEPAKSLAYYLFQVEANKAWTTKPILLFVWLRYTNKKNYGKPIDVKLAEASAMFPFFLGIEGMWLYESDKYRNTMTKEDKAVYNSFLRGLYRISEYKHFFEGHHKLIMKKSARDHFVDKDPVWRGVEKNGKLLVIAQNPYAKKGQKHKITISHKNLKKEITLDGQDVFLMEYKL